MNKKSTLIIGLLALALIIGGAYYYWQKSSSATVGLQCPATFQNHALKGAQVFDGPPSQLADLIPTDEQTTTWDLSEPAASKKGYYLGCTYDGISAVVPVRLPATVKSCTITGSNIVCVANTTQNNKVVISRTRAVELVSARPEVVAYLASVKKAGGNGTVAASDTLGRNDNGDPAWVVQVYENRVDHNATYGWYTVNAQTGIVEKQI